MAFQTKIPEGFQTVVPSKIRKKYDLEAHDSVQWKMNDNRVKKNEIVVTFRKKVTSKDITGIIEEIPLDCNLRKKGLFR